MATQFNGSGMGLTTGSLVQHVYEKHWVELISGHRSFRDRPLLKKETPTDLWKKKRKKKILNGPSDWQVFESASVNLFDRNESIGSAEGLSNILEYPVFLSPGL